jgi:hypothetical protein
MFVEQGNFFPNYFEWLLELNKINTVPHMEPMVLFNRDSKESFLARITRERV